MLQMVHPDRVVSEADAATLPLIEPVYPLTEGLSLNVVRKAAEAALDARARAARVAGCRMAAAAGMERFRRRADGAASPGRSRDGDAGHAGLVAARL